MRDNRAWRPGETIQCRREGKKTWSVKTARENSTKKKQGQCRECLTAGRPSVLGLNNNPNMHRNQEHRAAHGSLHLSCLASSQSSSKSEAASSATSTKGSCSSQAESQGLIQALLWAIGPVERAPCPPQQCQDLQLTQLRCSLQATKTCWVDLNTAG